MVRYTGADRKEGVKGSAAVIVGVVVSVAATFLDTDKLLLVVKLVAVVEPAAPPIISPAGVVPAAATARTVVVAFASFGSAV